MKARDSNIEWRLLQIALLVVGVLIVFSLYQEHEQLEARERDRLQVQVRIVAEHLTYELAGVNNAVAGVLDDFPNWDSKILGAAAVAHRLRDLSGGIAGLRTMAILDGKGTVIAASRDELTRMDFSQREHFKVARVHPGPDTLYVSAPFTTVLGAHVINMERAVVGPNGELAGIVSALLDPGYFGVLLNSALYAPDMRAGLTHGDGKTFLILSHDSQPMERDLRQPGTFFSRHLESRQSSSVLTGISHASGDERMIAQHTINPAGLRTDKPLVVSISRGLSAIYAPWRKRAIELGGLFGAIALLASFALYIYQQRRQTLLRHTAEMSAQWRKNNESMNLALAGADLGLWEWDLLSGKISFNDRWRDMLGYGFGEIEPDIRSWQRLVHMDDLPVIHAALHPHLNQETQSFEAEYRMRHKNGSWVWILGRGKVMERDAAGAPVRFMGTHMDITERKRQ
jgi:PAS domain S-box-containing protein